MDHWQRPSWRVQSVRAAKGSHHDPGAGVVIRRRSAAAAVASSWADLGLGYLQQLVDDVMRIGPDGLANVDQLEHAKATLALLEL